MQGKITKRAVDGLTPKDGIESVLWDNEVRGFGVRARAGAPKPTFSITEPAPVAVRRCES